MNTYQLPPLFNLLIVDESQSMPGTFQDPSPELSDIYFTNGGRTKSGEPKASSVNYLTVFYEYPWGETKDGEVSPAYYLNDAKEKIVVPPQVVKEIEDMQVEVYHKVGRTGYYRRAELLETIRAAIGQ
jgi:hypothetical protein